LTACTGCSPKKQLKLNQKINFQENVAMDIEQLSVPIETGVRSDAFTELVSGDLVKGDRLVVVEVKQTTTFFRLGLCRLLRNR
jgi:hypothetical protein